ncbi:GtrA family protein [Actinopolyspora mortivallis]|uniref:GtrA family protein n=1 Tax=Actinopolyspora mortivallis TaxID=33906 RepID=UPI0009FC8DD8|nr:GtrA family protein [Actinopolyspora mortivallis]
MSVVDTVLTRVPTPLRGLVVRHRELVKFAFVGASTFAIDTALFYLLKWTVLEPKPVTAKVVAVLVATVVSYVLNREWAFRTRGGRRRHHEAGLYFLVSGTAVALYAAPLWISRYVLHLQTPHTTPLVEELADFTAGQVLGVLLGMAFRWWAFRRWVFPTREQESTEERSNVEPFPVERAAGERDGDQNGAPHEPDEERGVSRPAAG